MGQLRKDILRRHGLAAASVSIFTALYYVGYGIEYDQTPSVWFALITLLYLVGHAGVICFIAAGRTMGSNDPSMTLPVMLLVIVYMSGLMMLAPDLRGIMILGYLNIMPFGVFRLSGRAFVGISLATLACYSLVIFSTHYGASELLVPEFEVVIGFALVVSMLMYAFIGREFFILRQAYGEKNSDLRRALARIEELAVTDELTGLNNRRSLLKMLEKQRALAIRQNIPFVVAFIDIDYFKRINDEHGHRIGDQVLAELAQMLRVSIREIDLAARYGGEEFVLLLSGLSLETATNVLDRIQKSVEKHRFSELELQQRVSIGVAEYRPNEASEDVLNRADKMLYEAKRLGRNRIVVESD